MVLIADAISGVIVVSLPGRALIMHRMFVAAVPASSDGQALGREALCSTKGLPALARRTYPFLPMRYGSAVLAAFVSISCSHVFLAQSRHAARAASSAGTPLATAMAR